MEYETNSRTFGFRRSPYSNRSKSRTSLTRRSKSKLEDIDLTSSIAEIYRKSKNRNSSNFHKKSIKDSEYTDKSTKEKTNEIVINKTNEATSDKKIIMIKHKTNKYYKNSNNISKITSSKPSNTLLQMKNENPLEQNHDKKQKVNRIEPVKRQTKFAASNQNNIRKTLQSSTNKISTNNIKHNKRIKIANKIAKIPINKQLQKSISKSPEKKIIDQNNVVINNTALKNTNKPSDCDSSIISNKNTSVNSIDNKSKINSIRKISKIMNTVNKVTSSENSSIFNNSIQVNIENNPITSSYHIIQVKTDLNRFKKMNNYVDWELFYTETDNQQYFNKMLPKEDVYITKLISQGIDICKVSN